MGFSLDATEIGVWVTILLKIKTSNFKIILCKSNFKNHSLKSNLNLCKNVKKYYFFLELLI